MRTIRLRLRCLAFGHADGLPFPIGMSLHVRCAECGRLSDGVPLSTPRFRITQPGDRHRQAIYTIKARVLEWKRRYRQEAA